MEVILVLIVGATLLAGGTLMYNQMRENAGSAAANSKAMQLHGVIEKLASESGGSLPTADALRARWKEVRQQDWDKSPWGGKAQCTGANCADGIRVVTVCQTDSEERCFDDNKIPGANGALVYFRYFDRPRVLPPYLDIWDNSEKLYVHTSRYAVAVENAEGRQFYFVHGPSDLDSNGNPRPPDSTRGKYGNCSCFEGITDKLDPYGR